MKSYVILMIISFLFLFGSCTSYAPKDIEKRYTKLSTELDILMDKEIVEKKREKLEKEYTSFINGMKEYKKENGDIDTKYLDLYIKNSTIKLQYIRDLRD